jgi:hypothetical protein
MNAKGFICPRTVTACVWWRYNMPRTSDMTGNHHTIPCYGCGALAPNEDGPAHRYIGASPGCWAVYGEVLARASADPAWGDDQLLILNSYCAASGHAGAASDAIGLRPPDRFARGAGMGIRFVAGLGGAAARG